MPFNIGSRRWVRLLLFGVGVYLALLPLWWLALPILASASGFVADWIFGLLDARVSIVPEGRVVRVLVAALDGQPTSSGLRLDTVTYGLPMFAALVMVTRADSLRAKLRTLLLGLALMSALTIPVVMAWAKLTTLQVDERLAASGNSSGFLYYAFHGYAFSQPVVAIVLWLGMMMLGMFKDTKKPDSSTRIIRRNAPCPCGSGRKYKRCCGLASPIN
ncbi:MAG TPA: SEC-C domain-containing protein [Blastocatellia bacterium]|nr:SEC-C domain-containing protein [Blastocatellia bacterium]